MKEISHSLQSAGRRKIKGGKFDLRVCSGALVFGQSQEVNSSFCSQFRRHQAEPYYYLSGTQAACTVCIYTQRPTQTHYHNHRCRKK